MVTYSNLVSIQWWSVVEMKRQCIPNTNAISKLRKERLKQLNNIIHMICKYSMNSYFYLYTMTTIISITSLMELMLQFFPLLKALLTVDAVFCCYIAYHLPDVPGCTRIYPACCCDGILGLHILLF